MLIVNRQFSIFNFQLLIIALVVCTGTQRSYADTLRVSTQREFDGIQSAINAAVSAGDRDIVVKLAKGTFFFKDRHINLSDKKWDDVRIAIRGNETVITPRNELLRDTTPPEHNSVADREIEVENEADKLCRLHGRGIADRSEAECENTYILITQWFKSATYKVVRIRKGWVYFVAHDLSYNKSYRCYNVNLDLGYSRKMHPGAEVMPRYRIFEDPAAKRADGVSPEVRFLALSNSSVSALDVGGITFKGNAQSADRYLIYINKVQADSVLIRDCSFVGVRSGVIQVLDCNNVTIRRNRFSLCHRNGIYASNSLNTVIADNLFENMGLACLNTFCIRCSGTNYLITRNEMCDFGYCGIGLGVWWQTVKRTEQTGIVERNRLYYTQSYMALARRRNGLMDSGAIYLYTQNDEVHIRRNLIHDYVGACDNRGIFCDDGASGFRIYENIIVNTPNSYSIDSRRTANIETNEKSKAQRVNVNNQIFDNIVDGAIRAEGREGDSGCRFGPNKTIKKGAKVSDLIQKSNIFAP